MNFCCSHSSSHIMQKCRKHQKQYLSLFCAHRKCMEPICENCKYDHIALHESLKLGKHVLISLKQAQDIVKQSTQKELQIINSNKTCDYHPSVAVDKVIDQFFYGSNERRKKILQEQLNTIDKKFTAQYFVNAIERNHEYSIPEGFKEKYFQFLDNIVKGAIEKHKKNHTK